MTRDPSSVDGGLRDTAGASYAVLSVVAVLSGSGRYGGPAETSLRQCELLRAEGFRARVLAGEFAGDERRAPHAEVHRIRQWLPGAGYSGIFSWKILSALWRATGDVDAVFVSFGRELIPVTSALIALARRRRLVLQPHGMLTVRTSRAHRASDVVVRRIFCKADAVVALTQVEERQLRKWAGASGSGSHIEVIGNPVPPGVARVNDARSRSALFAARLHRRKRVEDFLTAAALSNARGEGIDYLVAGPDQGDLALVEDAARSNPHLRYLGALAPDELEARVAQAGVFVLTSEAEPWGNVLASAIVAGTPVVVTRSSALAHDVEALEVGLVVDDGDSEAVAAAVADILTGSFAAGPRGPVEERFGNAGVARRLAGLFRADEVRGGVPHGR